MKSPDEDIEDDAKITSSEEEEKREKRVMGFSWSVRETHLKMNRWGLLREQLKGCGICCMDLNSQREFKRIERQHVREIWWGPVSGVDMVGAREIKLKNMGP